MPLSLGKFEAWITVDDAELPQYDPQVSEDGITMSCWIPSEVGKVRRFPLLPPDAGQDGCRSLPRVVKMEIFNSLSPACSPWTASRVVEHYIGISMAKQRRMSCSNTSTSVPLRTLGAHSCFPPWN